MESKFDGTVLEILGVNVVVWLLTGITLGFAYPWALTLKRRFVTKHTIVDGRRLNFDGTGGQLFGTWIKMFLLTVITIGIYSFWAEREIQCWVARHTHFDAPAVQVAQVVPVLA